VFIQHLVSKIFKLFRSPISRFLLLGCHSTPMSCSRWYIWAARKGISKRGRTRSSFFLQQIHITPQNEMGMVIRGSTYSLMLPLQQLNSHCKVQTTWRKEEDEMFVVIRKKQVHRRRNRRCCVFSGLRVVASPASCW